MSDWPVMILIMALVLVVFGAASMMLRSRAFVRSAAAWQVVDVSHLEAPPPSAAQPLIAALIRLGFHRLGEAGRANKAQTAGPVQVWYFVDERGTTCAGVFTYVRVVSNLEVPTRELAGAAVIYSWFGEEAVIVTGYGSGEHIEEPNFRFHVISTSLEEAYRHHLAQLPDFQMRYGAPVRFDSMAQVIHLDAVYNARFARRRMRPTMIRSLGTSLFQLYLIILLLGTVLALQTLPFDPWIVIAAAGVLTLPALVLMVRLRRRQGG